MRLNGLNKLDFIVYYLIIALFVVLPFSRAGANIFSGLLFLTILTRWIITKRIDPVEGKIARPMVALLAVGAVSLVFAIDMQESILTFFSPLVKYVVVFYAVLITINTEKRKRVLLATMLVTGFIISLYGIYEYLYLSVGRVSALLYNPNRAGGFLAIYTTLSISILLISKMKILKVALFITSIVGLIATILTFSRGALIGLVGAIALLMFILVKRSYSLKIWAIAVLAVLLVVALAPDTLVHRFGQALDLDNNSNKQRILLWQTAWNMFLDRPLFGVGPGGFKALYEHYRLPGAGSFDSAHNVYLQILAELGVLGFFSFLWLGWSIVTDRLKSVMESPKGVNWAISLASVLGITSVAIHGSVDTALLTTVVGVFIAGLSGLACETCSSATAFNENNPISARIF